MKNHLLPGGIIVLIAALLTSCSAPGAEQVQGVPPPSGRSTIYVEPFVMREGSAKQKWMGSAMAEFFLHGWRRAGVASPVVEGSRYQLLGEYWVKNDTLRISARLARGMMPVETFHWEGGADSTTVVPLWMAMVKDVNAVLKSEGVAVAR